MNGPGTSIGSRDCWPTRACAWWWSMRIFRPGSRRRDSGTTRPWGPSCAGACLREYERWQLVGRQIKDLETERRRRIHAEQTPHVDKVRLLLGLWGVGINGAWLLVYELFAWRRFANRKQVGSIVGMTPTPYQSGDSAIEQGISKAGNRRLRRLLVELAWCWLRWQPDSPLSQWYERRFARGGRRAAQDRRGGRGPQAADCLVEIPGTRRGAGGGALDSLAVQGQPSANQASERCRAGGLSQGEWEEGDVRQTGAFSRHELWRPKVKGAGAEGPGAGTFGAPSAWLFLIRLHACRAGLRFTRPRQDSTMAAMVTEFWKQERRR